MGHRGRRLLGRVTSPDPSGQETNPYLYAEGGPVNRIDPQGTLSFGGVLEGYPLSLIHI